ncbi:toxin-antitoxin system YwqK family antitoxin [Marinirhabdus gelatinilytica]|uniref:MORN repeat protein n=1 Tax=Marinirhabdus gelatinilytica TaxID=1703343 RepID=A0A370QIV9_9FLAO|nr:nicotinic acid mononucleotide adenyltransferase [Marinirhabdus gelatinilytica]RDK88303.1 hypothetical protein C8D94_101173 [Marinirhabdus gelatinilytica]
MKNAVLILVCFFSLSIALAQTDNKEKLTIDGALVKTVQYHDNGAIAQTGFYTKENKLHGEWVSYDANGKKLAVAQYDNGNKVGTWKFYQGDTMKEVTYANSKIAKVNTWEAKDTRVVSYK